MAYGCCKKLGQVNMLRTANSPKDSELLPHQCSFILGGLTQQDQSAVESYSRFHDGQRRIKVTF